MTDYAYTVAHKNGEYTVTAPCYCTIPGDHISAIKAGTYQRRLACAIVEQDIQRQSISVLNDDGGLIHLDVHFINQSMDQVPQMKFKVPDTDEKFIGRAIATINTHFTGILCRAADYEFFAGVLKAHSEEGKL